MLRPTLSPAPSRAPGSDGPAALLVAILPVAILFVVAHALCLTQYGIFRDELYYVACSQRLEWGYVDHPPFAMVVLAAVRAVLGDSLAAMRVVTVVVGVVHLLLVGALVRELGGGRFARALAALAAVLSPATLFLTHAYTMNVFDLVFWSAGALALLVALRTGTTRAWVALGAIVGLGLLNKWSMAWFAGASIVAVALTRERRVFASRGPWLAAAIAAALVAPNLLWQQANGWPTLEFMANAAAFKMLSTPPHTFLFEQVTTLHPFAAPVWVAGLVALLAGRFDARGRVLGIAWLAVLALLLLRGTSRAVYLLPAYAPLFAAGATVISSRLRHPAGRTLLVAVLAAAGAALAPIGLPLLSPARYVEYQRALGIAPPQQERGERPTLPQHFADMHGWEDLALRVAGVWETLTPEERERAAIFADNYGEAGAIDRFGPALGLPPAMSGHNQYWMWGPGRADGSVIVTIGGDETDMRRNFTAARIADRVKCEWCMPYENGKPIWVARGLRLPISAVWPAVKHYQ